ncbi:hypothetical protein TNCV_1986981 [Trichonephila clavipes]|nr:hypothetical protein TNCV_1986981 [Trichonephila clavipes]
MWKVMDGGKVAASVSHWNRAPKEAGIEKNFDFDQSLEREQKPSVEETRRHFSKTSFRLCRGWNHRQIFRLCRDERVSRNEREVTLEKQKIELAKLQLAKLEKEVELQRAKNKALSLNPAAKVVEKQFETLNKETATHIGIREAEDWLRPIDLAKECDIYISSKNGSHKEIPITYGYTQDPFKNRSQNFKPKIKKRTIPNILKEKIKIALYAVIHLIAQETVRSVFKPKESNDHIHNRINVNTLKVESEKQNSDGFEQFQYVNIFCRKSARNSLDRFRLPDPSFKFLTN